MEKNKIFSIQDIVVTALFSALMVAGAYISIPLPAPLPPLTFQPFFSIYAGLLLRPKNAIMSQVIYILLGLAGLPVFANRSLPAGPGYVFSPTFGYLLGFALTALVISLILKWRKDTSYVTIGGAAIIGFVIMYAVGNVYFTIIMNAHLGKEMSFIAANKIMFPFMVKDFVLLIVAVVSSKAMLPAIRKNFSFS